MTRTRQWVLLTAVAAVVILAAGWLLLIKPQKAKVSSLHTQTTQQQQANQLLLTQIQALQVAEKNLPEQQLLLAKFSTEIPDNPAEPTLIRQLSTAASSSGVDLSAITPGGAAPVAVNAPPPAQTPGSTASTSAAAATPALSLYELPLTLQITGPYANIESFFSSLERLPRALLVMGFTVGAGSSSGAPAAGPNTLSAGLNADVFYAPGSAPLPIPSAAPPATPAPAGGTPNPSPAVNVPTTVRNAGVSGA
jgi:Tfp pilus assembly protein PilO